MKPICSLMFVVAATAVAWTPATSQAQEWPTIGSVMAAHQGHLRDPYAPMFTPGTNVLATAPNGAIHSIYTPGHSSFGTDRGPTFYAPGFRSSYEAPGSLHYYYGVYAPHGVNPFP